MSVTAAQHSVTGLVLAGGQARRMGGEDKGLIELAHRPLLAWVLDCFVSQVDEVLISANRNHSRYAAFGHRVIADQASGFLGPLAGLAAGLAASRTPWLVMVPCDSPFLPHDLVARFLDVALSHDTPLVCAHDGSRLQPVFSLVHATLLSDLSEYLAAGERKIDQWFEQHSVSIVDFSSNSECFENFNSKEEILTSENTNDK